MPLTENYTVYKHTNKRNGKVYIGITRQEVNRRWQNGTGYTGTYFGNAIAKYGWDGFKHEVLFSGLSKEDACKMEIRLISEFQSSDRAKGYNISDGGQTGDNLKAHFGVDNYKAVSVKRIDPRNGDCVVYDTVASAANTMGINHRGISKACRGVSKTYNGYVWEYADGRFDKPVRCERGKYNHIKQKKAVCVIDVDGGIYRFDGILDAAQYFGIRQNTASRYASGVRHDPTGRRWSKCP